MPSGFSMQAGDFGIRDTVSKFEPLYPHQKFLRKYAISQAARKRAISQWPSWEQNVSLPAVLGV
jgi:hypothetical protein